MDKLPRFIFWDKITLKINEIKKLSSKILVNLRVKIGDDKKLGDKKIGDAL